MGLLDNGHLGHYWHNHYMLSNLAKLGPRSEYHAPSLTQKAASPSVGYFSPQSPAPFGDGSPNPQALISDGSFLIC